ncbi:hypothetical protein B0I35DRAFT_454508 [Stachybotrys elegans]|uniref:MYND-type zinc finger protein samB n=1 Tax=Stachybotrys elegans TaxID=80388 RepID=A0A8K0WK80_9HYPO|nr:hypothetical protein B0I35DRAFT_454508 [Stachybotrys elegans]
MQISSAKPSREHWLELVAARQQRERCAQEVEAIKRSCENDCEKKSPAECLACREKIIDRIRARYCEDPDHEWFVQRTAFLQRLDGMFTDAKAHRVTMKSIDESIESEKEAWYRWVLRKYPEFLAIADRSIDTDDLRNMLDDPDRPLRELIAMMWKALEDPVDWSATLDEFTKKVAAAEGNAEALRKLYAAEFFTDKATGQLLEGAEAYRDEYMQSGSMLLEHVIDKLIMDHHNFQKSKPQRDEIESKIISIRRARQAHEQKIQNKINAKNQASAVNEKLYDLPVCSVCKSAADPKDVLSCSACQAIVLLGGDGALTVYCSNQCYQSGHASHAEKMHDCKAGDNCIQERDDDVSMTGDSTDSPVVCVQCVEGKKLSIYCSDRCARENMSSHRLSEHADKESSGPPSTLTTPLSEVLDKTLKKDNPGLQASNTPRACPASAAAPPSTFSIDFDVPAPEDIDDSFETLRDSHAASIEALFPDTMVGGFEPSLVAGMPTPPASSSHSHPIQSMHTKPRFNRASADSLLASFSAMLAHFPCIMLPADVTVSHLAATKPFVLLAILAASSGSRTLQGHLLYDEEFRKVLGLKVVAGGERSLELLQGILIYCAWYPFHLRPKNKQVFHYLRMAADLVSDLELDQEPRPGDSPFGIDDPELQLETLRAYLGFYFALSRHCRSALSWSRYKNLIQSFTPWVATCCDMLEANAQGENDRVLVAIVRIAGAIGDMWESLNTPGQSAQQIRLLLLGLESQWQSLRRCIPADIATSVPVKLALSFGEMYLHGSVLTRDPRKAAMSISAEGDSLLSPTKLLRCAYAVKEGLDMFLALDEAVFMHFTAVEWNRFVVATILAILLCFPLKDCPEFDSSWARSQIQLDHFLRQMTKDTSLTQASKQVDVLSATRVVLRVVLDKYERRVADEEAVQAMSMGPAIGCPMIDGSLDSYIPCWDIDLTASGPSPTTAVPKAPGDQQVFHDLWATMTLGWAQDDNMLNVGEEYHYQE